jgi:excinuclease ABC subunit B
MSKKQLEKTVEDLKRAMKKAAKETDFMEAARLRDEMYAYEKILKERF